MTAIPDDIMKVAEKALLDSAAQILKQDAVVVIAEAIKSEIDKAEAERDALREERDRIERNRDMWKGQVERQADTISRLRKLATHSSNCGYRFGHDCDCDLSALGREGA